MTEKWLEEVAKAIIGALALKGAEGAAKITGPVWRTIRERVWPERTLSICYLGGESYGNAEIPTNEAHLTSLLTSLIRLYEDVLADPEFNSLIPDNCDEPKEFANMLASAMGARDPNWDGSGRGLCAISASKSTFLVGTCLYAGVYTDRTFITSRGFAPKIAHCWYLFTRHRDPVARLAQLSKQSVSDKSMTAFLGHIYAAATEAGAEFFTFEIVVNKHGVPDDESKRLLVQYASICRQLARSPTGERLDLNRFLTPYVCMLPYKNPEAGHIRSEGMMLCVIPLSTDARATLTNIDSESTATNLIRKVCEGYWDYKKGPERRASREDTIRLMANIDHEIRAMKQLNPSAVAHMFEPADAWIAQYMDFPFSQGHQDPRR